VDELKQINDKLGHQAGSDVLVQTAELLKTTFRDSDVVGRIGGDEFALCGQFSPTAISIAALRLKAGANLHRPDGMEHAPLSLSVGYVTSGEHQNDSLEDLLARADEAMYEQKRRKKTQPR
jgi:diguanylate cyclase (GGDEF)-like protein